MLGENRLISLGYMRYQLLKQHKSPKYRQKINEYFDTFVVKNKDLTYFWIKNKLFVTEYNNLKIKKELEKLIGKQVRLFRGVDYGSDVKEISVSEIKRIESEKKLKAQKEKKLRSKKIEANFRKQLNEFKQKGCLIGSFDLEFWEKDFNKILEIGWTIFNNKTKQTETKHIIIKENTKYQNHLYSINNRDCRNDSESLDLSSALTYFEKYFINKVDLFVGHGLDNDIKVLKANGIDFDKDYVELAEIGALKMNKDDKVSLTNLLSYLDIFHKDLHNAANDAEYIMKAFKRISEYN